MSTVFRRWVVLLPILTTTAAFPLFNATLASNLEECLPPGRLRSRPIAGMSVRGPRLSLHRLPSTPALSPRHFHTCRC